jgi:hypothetical protein
MTSAGQLILHPSVLSERALIWMFITITAFIACLGTATYRSAPEAMPPQNDRERIRAIEFWIHCA